MHSAMFYDIRLVDTCDSSAPTFSFMFFRSDLVSISKNSLLILFMRPIRDPSDLVSSRDRTIAAFCLFPMLHVNPFNWRICSHLRGKGQWYVYSCTRIQKIVGP